MIVRNEERVLADCLKSIRPWVDEMIVVDTGSTDRTVSIAKEHGARVYHFPWCDSFSAARNESIRHATGDWIFWMDADDVIPAECGQPLREIVFLAEERVDGFMLQVHCPPKPGETGLTQVDHVKLFRNIPELRFEYRMHEQILASINRHGGQIRRTPLYVVHAGYDHSPEGQARKRERDLRLLHLDLEERPGDPFVLFNLGMTWFHMKELDKAQQRLEECLSVSKPYESTVRKVYSMLAGCHEQQGRIALARERIDQGLALFPRDPELLFRAGIVYREAGDLAAAERSYLMLLREPEQGHIDSLDVSMMTYKARHNLALIYQDRQQWAEAEAQFREALSSSPGFTPSLLGLAELYQRTGRVQEAEAIRAQIRS